MHVRGYKEKGNIDTPLELAIRNEADRYSLAIVAIDNLVEHLGNKVSYIDTVTPLVSTVLMILCRDQKRGRSSRTSRSKV